MYIPSPSKRLNQNNIAYIHILVLVFYCHFVAWLELKLLKLTVSRVSPFPASSVSSCWYIWALRYPCRHSYVSHSVLELNKEVSNSQKCARFLPLQRVQTLQSLTELFRRRHRLDMHIAIKVQRAVRNLGTKMFPHGFFFKYCIPIH